MKEVGRLDFVDFSSLKIWKKAEGTLNHLFWHSLKDIQQKIVSNSNIFLNDSLQKRKKHMKMLINLSKVRTIPRLYHPFAARNCKKNKISAQLLIDLKLQIKQIDSLEVEVKLYAAQSMRKQKNGKFQKSYQKTFHARINMFDLSQSNYLVQSKPQQPYSLLILSQACPFPSVSCMQPCNLLIDSTKPENTKNDGKWSLREIMRYYLFLVQFKYLFKSKELRKTNRVFSLMAKHIRSRKTSQCKSHHQKIQKNYGNIQEIIKHYKFILAPLKQQWKQFQKTQKRVLVNEYPEHNNGQDYYQVLGFKNCLRIYIREECIRAYTM